MLFDADFLIFLCVIQPRKEFAALGSTTNKVLYSLVLLFRVLVFVLAFVFAFDWLACIAVIAVFTIPISGIENLHPRTTSLLYILASTLMLGLSMFNGWHRDAIYMYSALTFRYDIVVSYHTFRKQLQAATSKRS